MMKIMAYRIPDMSMSTHTHSCGRLVPRSRMNEAPRLQVQTLRLALCLCLQHALPGSTEVLHVHPHSSLAESQETSLGANGLDIGTGKVILLVDELIQVNVLVQGHLGCVQGEDFLLGRFWTLVSDGYMRDSGGQTYGQGSRRGSFGRYGLDGSRRGRASQSCW